MTTIRDVAAAAGVSTATVSRALSGRGYVSEATRQRVAEIAAELGFRPNPLARGLKTRRSGLVGVVVPEIRDPFFAAVAQGMEEVASASGYTVMVGASLNDRAREATYLRLLASRNVDGVIVAPAREAAGTLAELARLGLPAVFIDDWPEGEPVDAVHSDNVGGARRLTAHLIGLGHRRIGLVMGRAACAPGGQRIRGYRAALEEAGIPVDPDLVRHGPWTAEFAEGTVADLLALPDPPTALVTGSTLLTAGAMEALRGLGLRAPEDIAVAGFDALPMADAVDPFLTVAAQRMDELCRQAAELLIRRVDGTDDGPPREIVLPVDLLVRRSCGAPGQPPGTPPAPTVNQGAARMSTSLPVSTRTVPARIDLAVTEWPADGPPLVLLHGIGSSACTWQAVAPRLAERYHLYAVDMRGHGASARPEAGYLLEDYADDLDALLDALELDRPYVLGHSLGSLTALTWASRHPGRAAAMALEDPPLRTVPEILEAFDGWMALNAMAPADLAAHYAGEYPHWTPEECRARAETMAGTHPPVFGELRAEAARNLAAGTVDRLDALAAIDVPTLLVMGDLEAGSMTVPEDAARLAGIVPDLRIYRIPGAGHSIHRDRSDEFLAAVTGFFGA